MSVENLDHVGGVVEFLDDQTPQDCFYCGKPLAGITVLWHGKSSSKGDTFDIVGMHPNCAIELGAQLCRDGLNAEFIEAGKSPLLGVAKDLRGTSGEPL